MRGCWRIAMGLVACGPRVAPADSGADEAGTTSVATTGTTTSTTDVDESTTGLAETTSGPIDATSSSGASEGSTTTGPPPGEHELEGLMWYCTDCFELQTYFRPCGETKDWCLTGNAYDVLMCTGAYARVTGHFVENPDWSFDAPCGPYTFEVDAVLEARWCEPSDCGGTECQAVDCDQPCSFSETCPDGHKCVPWEPLGSGYDGTRCVPVDPDPASMGEPCTRSAEDPAIDDCDVDSVCVDVDPETSTGVCATLCWPYEDDPGCPPGEECTGVRSSLVAYCEAP